jgi:hypothetical protein
MLNTFILYVFQHLNFHAYSKKKLIEKVGISPSLKGKIKRTTARE